MVAAVRRFLAVVAACALVLLAPDGASAAPATTGVCASGTNYAGATFGDYGPWSGGALPFPVPPSGAAAGAWYFVVTTTADPCGYYFQDVATRYTTAAGAQTSTGTANPVAAGGHLFQLLSTNASPATFAADPAGYGTVATSSPTPVATTAPPTASPSPSPTPVVTASASPTPLAPTAAPSATPTPVCGSVDNPCMVTLAADQYTPAYVLGGVGLFLGLATFTVYFSKPWRMR